MTIGLCLVMFPLILMDFLKHDFMWMFCLHVCMCILYVPSNIKRGGIFWNWSERWLWSIMLVLKLSLGPPQNQQVFVTAELSLQPYQIVLLFVLSKRIQQFKNQECYYVCSTFYYKNNLWWIATLKNIFLWSWGWSRTELCDPGW